MIEIKRQKEGRAPTKWGILLRNLPPRYRKILKRNRIFKKYSDDDRFVMSIFRMEDMNIVISNSKRPFVNPETKEVSTYANIISQYTLLDWKCAYCETKIKTKINTFKAENFTCEKCFNYYIKNSKKYNQKIVDSSLEFMEYCRRIHIENQKKFIKYIKRNEI